MIKILNYNGNTPNILHFLGKSRHIYKSVMNDVINNSKFESIDNLTIITCFNDRSKACLADSLERNKVDYINAFTGDEEDPWVMTNKIYYYNEALEKVTTDYVLLLDGNDVVILDLNLLLEKFLDTELDICFCATRNNHPKVLIDKIPNRDWRGEFRYLNAGCVIGKTSAIKDFYKKVEDTIFKFPNPWGSELFVIRHVFKDCNLNKVDFDWKCNLFQTFSESTFLFVEELKEDNKTIQVYLVL